MKRATNLRELREELGITQEELGSFRIERGISLPGLHLRRQITERLNAAGAQVTVPEVMDLCRAHQVEGVDAVIESGPHSTIEGPRS